MNTWAKMRKVDNPYLTLHVDDWTWKVLKSWQAAKNDLRAYARWFCAVSSPGTHGRYDMGDVYVSAIMQAAHLAGLEGKVLEVIQARQRAEEVKDGV